MESMQRYARGARILTYSWSYIEIDAEQVSEPRWAAPVTLPESSYDAF